MNSNIKKNKFIIAFSFFLLISIFIWQIVPVYAEQTVSNNTTNNKKNTEEYDVNVDDFTGFKKWAWNTVSGVYDKDFFGRLVNIIAIDISAPKKGEKASPMYGVWSAINGYYNDVLSIGYCLIVIYFLVGIAEKTTRDNFTPEHFIKMWIKLIVAIAIMNNLLTIIGCLMSLGNWLTERFSLNLSENNEEAHKFLNNIATDIDEGGVINAAGIALNYIIPSMCMFFAKIVAQLICYTRFIEIAIRIVFSPIAIADLFGEGLQGPGFRFLKRFFAVCIQGAIIMAVLICMYSLQTSITASTSFNATAQVMVFFTAVAVLSRTQAIAYEVVGA